MKIHKHTKEDKIELVVMNIALRMMI